MLLEGDIAGSSLDMMLAVHFELRSEPMSVEKTLYGIEGRGHIVCAESVADLLRSSPGLVVSTELVFLIPAFFFCTEVTEAVPMLPLPVVLIIFSR